MAVTEVPPEGAAVAGGGDARVHYTRRVLREALRALLDEAPLDQITVQRLCHRAGVHRSTFYRNYRGLDDLAADVERQMYAEAFPQGIVLGDRLAFLRLVYDNQPFYRQLYRSGVETELSRAVERGSEERVVRLAEAGGLAHADALALSRFAHDGWGGMVRDWVLGGCVQTPEELLAQMERVERFDWRRIEAAR